MRLCPDTRAADAMLVACAVLSFTLLPPSAAQVPASQAARYQSVVIGEVSEGTLAADETVTYVYNGRSNDGLDLGERFMLVELTYEADGDQYPDPLLMVAYESVPFIFYAENQFTTNATWYDQVAFQLVKTYHYVVVDRQGIQPGSWYITITNLPVWSQNSLDFRLTVTTSGMHPCPNRCSNHGTCTADGSCACTPGWGDSDCSQQMQPIALETTISTHLAVDEWQYFYVNPLAAGDTTDHSGYIVAEMEITSNPRCDALLYFKHEDAGFTALPTHYDFQHHSDSQSFYAYEKTYQVKSRAIQRGNYVVGIYNYKGRRVEADCTISLTVTACFQGDNGCENSHNSHAVFHTTTGWFLGLFLLAGLPLFCFVPCCWCIRRLRLAHQRPQGHDDVAWAGNRLTHARRPPRPNPGLTSEQISSVPSFVYEPGNADQSRQYPNLQSDACSVCLMEFETGDMYVSNLWHGVDPVFALTRNLLTRVRCVLLLPPSLRDLRCRHVFHSDCIDQWLRRQRTCPLCKGDAMHSAANDVTSSTLAGGSAAVALDMPNSTEGVHEADIDDMPGTPRRERSQEGPATLAQAGTGDEEEARPARRQTHALDRLQPPNPGREPPPLPRSTADSGNSVRAVAPEQTDATGRQAEATQAGGMLGP